ncbi:hypothetical protein ST47_g890 [Ascochyta rabiei]|uniref:Uncharacterized protein n=1 Tax=Didymella rabiei TaxID=5454 RepID=A0A163LNU4_DIDRA|nr:hypothetical protein ST47_g890 [Ascochyta rabiei]
MKTSILLTAAALVSGIHGCFLTAHSSTVGDCHGRKSEPKNHGGARQFVNWSKDACNIKGELLNGCTVNVSSTKGCGSVSFSIWKPGRFARGFQATEAEM